MGGRERKAAAAREGMMPGSTPSPIAETIPEMRPWEDSATIRKGYALGVALFMTNVGRPGLRHCRVHVRRGHGDDDGDLHLQAHPRHLQRPQAPARHRRD